MDFLGKTIGFAMTGSFCTFRQVIPQTGANVIPVMSEMAYSTDTRFGTAADFRAELEKITGNPIVKSVKEAEPFGPKEILDLFIIAPCTGNTLAKLAHGIADGPVTLGAKAHLRNQRPLLIAVSTNDGLGNAAKNIGMLLNYKYTYFVPFRQDDCIKKPNSLVADMTQLTTAAKAAFDAKQLQPILC